LQTKLNIKKNIASLLRTIIPFGKKKEKELLGSSHIKKSKILNIVKKK